MKHEGVSFSGEHSSLKPSYPKPLPYHPRERERETGGEVDSRATTPLEKKGDGPVDAKDRRQMRRRGGLYPLPSITNTTTTTTGSST